MLQENLNLFIAKILVKEVEYGAEMARQFGFDFPKEYDFGFSGKILHGGFNYGLLAVTLRINDFSHSFEVKVGSPEEEDNLSTELHGEASELVSRYITAHPEIRPSQKSAQEIERWLKTGGEKDITLRAAMASDGATYTEV